MTSRTAAEALADATAALVHKDDVADMLLRLLRDCATLLSADAVALLVRTGRSTDAELELLSATSHKASELEVFQARQLDGPCVDTIRTGAKVEATDEESIRRRWPELGSLIVEAGFRHVRAYPLVWREETIGGLNLFTTEDPHADDDQDRTAQALADLATLMVVQSSELSTDQVYGRIRSALRGRIVIEQTKGVLSYLEDVDMETAYQLIMDRAEREDSSVTAVARAIIMSARQRPVGIELDRTSVDDHDRAPNAAKPRPSGLRLP